jgi:hypothetical protein
VPDPFPVGVLLHWVEVKDKPGAASGLWLCDAVLVTLGLRTMPRANKLASLTIADVMVKGQMMTGCVRWIKTNPTSQGDKVFVEATGSPTCPERQFTQYLAWHRQKSGLLFMMHNRTRMSLGAITAVCRWMVEAVGGDEKVFAHWLCIGGAIEGGLTK